MNTLEPNTSMTKESTIRKEGPMTNRRDEKFTVKLKETQQGIDRLTELLRINLMSLRIKLRHSPKGTKPRVLQAFYQMFYQMYHSRVV